VETAVQAKLGKRPSKAKANRASFRLRETLISFTSPQELTLAGIIEAGTELLKRARRAADLRALAGSLAASGQEEPSCSH